MKKKFTCQHCGETYNKIRPEEETWKEFYEENEGQFGDDIGILCDDCYIEYMKWFKKLTKEQKKQMRENYIKEQGN